MKIKSVLTIILGITFTLMSVPVFAAPDATLKDVVATVEELYRSVEDMQANFSQKTYIGALKREEKGGGELLLKKKGSGSVMFRFNYSRPKQQIISNGKTVWYYMPENRQVIVTDALKLFSGGNAIALSYLTGLGHLSEDFNIKLGADGTDKKGDYVLELVPKKSNQSVARLMLTVSGEAVARHLSGKAAEAGFPVVASVLHDQMGNRTTIEYSKIRVNRGLGSDRFTFKVPAGVETVKQ